MKNLRIASFLLLGTGACMLPRIAHADAIDCYPPAVTIESPADETEIEGAPADVPISVGVQPGGQEAELTRVWVRVDGDEAASAGIDNGGTYTLTVHLEAGTHEIVAIAEDDCGGPGESSPISVTITPAAGEDSGDDGVGEEGGGDSAGDSAGEGGGGEDDGGSTDDKGGCAVSRMPKRSLVGLSAFFLAVLGAWRLRRPDEKA